MPKKNKCLEIIRPVFETIGTRVDESLEEFFDGKVVIKDMWIVGSRAKGSCRKDSDIDVLVKIGKKRNIVSEKDLVDMALDLANFTADNDMREICTGSPFDKNSKCFDLDIMLTYEEPEKGKAYEQLLW